VHLQLFRLGDADLREELTNVVPLVALQLDHLAVLGVLDDGAVAREVFLARSDYLLLVEVIGDALNRGQGFPSVTLLDSDVDQTVLYTLVITPDGVRKRIECLQILDARHAKR